MRTSTKSIACLRYRQSRGRGGGNEMRRGPQKGVRSGFSTRTGGPPAAPCGTADPRTPLARRSRMAVLSCASKTGAPTTTGTSAPQPSEDVWRCMATHPYAILGRPSPMRGVSGRVTVGEDVPHSLTGRQPSRRQFHGVVQGMPPPHHDPGIQHYTD